LASQDIAIVNVSSQLAIKELDWRTKVSLEEGIKRTFKWLQYEMKNKRSLEINDA